MNDDSNTIYLAHKMYTRMGDDGEWVPLDNLVTKGDMVKLIDIIWKIAIVNNLQNKSETYEYLMDELEKLKENLK